MATFLSRATDYRLALGLNSQLCMVRFSAGRLDTAAEARRLGVPHVALLAALRKHKSNGPRFVEVPSVTEADETVDAKGAAV